jgi:hypothetical protein
VLCDNESSASKLNVSYSAVDLNKAEEDVGLFFLGKIGGNENTL